MLINTGAIVLKPFKYAENSIICKIYTEHFGIKTYLINNPHSRKSGFRAAFFQPLTLIDIVAYNKDKKQLQYLKEISCPDPLSSLHTSTAKSSIALFIAEILLKTIREEEANPPLFAYVRHFIQSLDKEKASCANYHLVFLLHLTQYLGFYPKTSDYRKGAVFDMPEGRFTLSRPTHSFVCEPVETDFIFGLLTAEAFNKIPFELNGQLRSVLLDKIIQYYQIHLEGMGKIQSADILKMVFE